MLLGDGQKPIGQVDFAEKSGLSVATVRSIESGNRGLTQRTLELIRLKLEATLNPVTGQWFRPAVMPEPYDWDMEWIAWL